MLQSEGVHNLCSHINTVDREILSFWHPIHTWIFPLYINLFSQCLMLHLLPSRSTALWQMDAQIKTEMSVIFLREIHVDAVKLIFCSMNTLEDAFFFFPPLTFSSHVKCRCGSLSHSCANKHQNEGGKKDDSSEEEEREKCLHHLCWRAMPCLHKKQAVRWRSIWFRCSSSGCICELYWSCTTERGEGGQTEKILSHYLSFVVHINT